MKSLKELYGIDSIHYPYYHVTFEIETLGEFIL